MTDEAQVVATEAEAAVEPSQATATKERTTRRRPQEPKRLSNPTIEREVKLATLQAQRVYLRTMGYVSSALFNLGVIMHIVGDADDARATENVVRDAIANVSNQLDAAIQRSAEMMKNANASADVTYSYLVSEKSHLQTPLAMQYLNLIFKLEEVVRSIDTLWMLGEIESGQRSATNAEWQRSILRLANEIITIQRRAYNSAINKGKQEELDKQDVRTVDSSVNETEDDDAEVEAVAEAI
jgi:hypothetical protein